MFLAKVASLVSLLVSGVWAQTDQAQCATGFEWNRNSLGQDACAIGSALDASCRGVATYNYPPINSSQYYLPPSKNHSGDLGCDCNTVMYNLYMACSSCQGGQIYSWTAWIAACTNVYLSQYPVTIPQGTAIPYWALFRVVSAVNQTYDQATMISLGRDPEETSPPTITLTAGSTSLSPSGSKSSAALPDSTSSSNNNMNCATNVGAIVGGVVGTVVPLWILAVVAFFCIRHRLQQKAQLQPSNPHKQHPTSMYTYAPLTPYNPSDPTTFPPRSLRSSVTYTTLVYNTRGAYSGAPEA